MEWEYLMTNELSIEEIKDLLIKLIQLKQNKKRELLQNEKDKTLEALHDVKSYLKGPFVLVDIREYLAPPELKSQGSHLTKNKKPVIAPIKKVTRKDNPALAKTYEGYLDMLDKLIYDEYTTYQKQTEIYRTLTQSRKKHLAEKIKSN